ncbi:hypothetical protein BH20ACT1_BH20ACT1_06070 [soil metagenome]
MTPLTSSRIRDRVHLRLLRLYQRLPPTLRRRIARQIPPSFTVGAICVLARADGALLLVRHSYRQRWGFPGGLAQRGEEVADAARREVEEEVGLTVELVGEPAVVVDPKPQRVDVVFSARVVGDEGSASPCSPEIVELAWFDPAELPQLQHEAAGALVALARARGRPPGGVPAPDQRD